MKQENNTTPEEVQKKIRESLKNLAAPNNTTQDRELFTGGDWKAYYDKTLPGYAVVSDVGDISYPIIAEIKVDWENHSAEANALLISEAKNMYHALNAVLNEWHSKDSNFHKKEPAYLKDIRSILTRITNKK